MPDFGDSITSKFFVPSDLHDEVPKFGFFRNAAGEPAMAKDGVQVARFPITNDDIIAILGYLPADVEELDLAVADAQAAASAAAAEADRAEAAATNAALSSLAFDLLSELNAVTGAFPDESATVYNDTDVNNGVYAWSGSAWVRKADNPSQLIAEIKTAFEPLMPTSSDLPTGTLVVLQTDGWILATLRVDAVNALTENLDWLIAAPTHFLPSSPTGGHLLGMQEDGWVVNDYDAPSTSSTAVVAEATDTAGQVAAVLTNQVENQPLLAGKNIFLSVGESTANQLDFMSDAFNQLCTQYSTPKPAGATVDDINDFHNAYTVDENIARFHHDSLDGTNGTTENIDAGFTSLGAECISAILMNEMGNDMVALNTPDYWESRVLHWINMIQNYSRQKYLGTVPTAIMPTPPCFLTMFCTWANGNLPTDIPMRAVEMSRRIYGFGISTAEYIADFSDNRHYLNPNEGRRIASWGGIANYEWRINKRKLHPTQVVDIWFDGTSAYLRFEMPKPPLQVSTARVSAIANNGLEAFTVTGTPYTITGVTILPNGQVVKVDKATPWVAGDQIWGAITPTTPGTAGRVTGNRSTLCDSSTYLINLGLGGGVELFQSYMLPFKRTLSLSQGIT